MPDVLTVNKKPLGGIGLSIRRPRRRSLRHAVAGALVTMLLATISMTSVAAADHHREPSHRPVGGPKGTPLEKKVDRLPRVSSGEIGVLSSNGFLYEDGTVAVVGDVLNLMTSRRGFVFVDVNFYNGQTLIGTLSGLISLTELAYGSTSPFLVYDDAPAGTTGTTTFVAEVSDPGFPDPNPPGGALKIVPGATSVVGQERHFTGTVQNLSNVEVEFGWVALATYDGSGEVIDSTYDLTTPDTIAAGASATYDLVVFYDPATPVARSTVTGEAWGTVSGDYHAAWSNYFDDVGPSPFRPDIIWNAEQGITTGCGPGKFCPNASVPRDQMASFLARALGLSGSAPNAFTDDNGNIHEPNINLVAAEGIASGCGVNLYCPAALVARDQMASFLSRALDLSGAAPNAFTDDNGNIHEPNINLVARDGIASGCGGTNYCPSLKVTRGQMAAFLHRAFD